LKKRHMRATKSMITPPIILDLEASGFGRGSYPIEVGLAMDDGHLESHLIQPFDHWTHWQESAEAIHGISRAQLIEGGEEGRFVADELNRLLHGQTVYSDGWGVDRSWLALLFHEAGVFQGFKIDTIFSLLSEVQLESWNVNKEKVLKITGLKLHRAGTDASLIQQTYLYTVDRPAFEKHLRSISAA